MRRRLLKIERFAGVFNPQYNKRSELGILNSLMDKMWFRLKYVAICHVTSSETTNKIIKGLK